MIQDAKEVTNHRANNHKSFFSLILNDITMKATLLAVLCLVGQACAFAPLNKALTIPRSFQALEAPEEYCFTEIVSEKRGILASSVTGLASGLLSFVASGLAADEYEMTELPPPYVPVGFALLLIAGVGVLTGSLGDVMTEGKFRPLWV
jgi:hypothetical protein